MGKTHPSISATMEKPNISLIITVLNEKKTIAKLLKSILQQTQLPNEVIITDAGSSDNTINIIKKFKQKHQQLKIKLLLKPGTNRSQGRNFAIKKTTSPIIAVTDAGCTLDQNWLKKITTPFKNPQISLVGGRYVIKNRTIFQMAAAQLTTANFQKITTKTFLASSRSFAFRKQAWKQIGGYPENLNTAEDLVFAHRLLQKGFKQALALDAIVNWYPPKNPIAILKQFYKYSQGDGQAGLASPHTQKYLIKTFIILILSLVFYYQQLSINTILIILFIYFLTISIHRSLHPPQKISYLYAKGLYPLAHFILAITITPLTLIGFWHGVIHRIIKT